MADAEAEKLPIIEPCIMANVLAMMRPVEFLRTRMIFCAEALHRAGKMSDADYAQVKADSHYSQVDWDAAVVEGFDRFAVEGEILNADDPQAIENIIELMEYIEWATVRFICTTEKLRAAGKCSDAQYDQARRDANYYDADWAEAIAQGAKRTRKRERKKG